MKLFLFLLLFSTGYLCAQKPFYIPIDNSSGLPSNNIYDIFQDSKGFMWFATGKGICRYDGNNIQTYSADFQTNKAGSCIAEDKYGRIWYENFDGFLYYVENGQLKSLAQEKPIGYFKYGISDNNILVLEQDGVQFYDLKTLKPGPKTRLLLNELKFSHYANGTLYILDKELHEVAQDGKVKTTALPENFKQENISPIVQTMEKGIVIVSKFTKDYFIFKNGKFSERRFDFPIKFIQNTTVIDNGLWLCTTEGITQFNVLTHKFNNYFPTKNISFIFRDKHSHYWISTLNEGLLFVRDLETKVIELPSTPIILSKSKNKLLVGAEKDAVYSLDTKNNQVNVVYKGKLNHNVTQLYADDLTDDLYFTTSSFKVITGGKAAEYQIGALKSIEKIDDKYFAFAASNNSGVFTLKSNLKSRWDNRFERFEKLRIGNLVKTPSILNCNGKSTTFNEINNTIYFATNTGLIATSVYAQEEVKFEGKSLYLNKLARYKGVVYGLSTNEKIYTVDPKNNVGLFPLDRYQIAKKVVRLAMQDELLFLFTDCDAYEINLKTNTSKKLASFSKDVQITDAKKINGIYYFASTKGIIVQDKQRDFIDESPKLFLNSFSVNDQNRGLKDKLKLNYDENNIKINFTILSSIPNEVHYVLYSINGSPWSRLELASENLLLSSLSPNAYEIMLKIEGGDESKVESIAFLIKKPFWLNTFVLLGFGLAILFAIFWFYRYRISKIKQKNELAMDKIKLEKNVNQAKLKSIKSQMNPHFFYNALNTLQSYILSNEKKQAVDYLSKFSNLTRTILDMTEKDDLSVAEEIRALTLYLEIEKARFDNDFSFKITSNFPSELENLKIPTMLLQPYVENAVKHGLLHRLEEKKLEIHFERSDTELKITIEDNGIGRKRSLELNKIKNKNHKSFATDATQNRIELLNQFTNSNISVQIIDLENDLGIPLGTKVIFNLPIMF